jgi:hypothetical protein
MAAPLCLALRRPILVRSAQRRLTPRRLTPAAPRGYNPPRAAGHTHPAHRAARQEDFIMRQARTELANRLRLAVITALALLLPASLAAAQWSQEDLYNPDDDNIYTRGPVHEAFAEPIMFEPEPGPLAPVAPPEPLNEIPPDYRPDGDNVDWISGYWFWDDDINQYLWISGIWRDVPPGREWMAGYWIHSQGGYRWIPGYWADAGRDVTYYLPEPPAFVEAGPNYAAAPSPDHIWVAGTWIWVDDGYAWRPGYWTRCNPDWVWVPAHYVWTPRGYVFVDGYWDRDVERRGVLFAPVYIERRIYQRPRFCYTPRTVIDTRVLTVHLFLREKHYHYYFGDYYDVRYEGRGYRPWFKTVSSRRCYDPIYVHQRWRHRNDRDWDGRLRRDYEVRRRDTNARPPRNWAEQRRYAGDRDRRFGGDRDDRSPFRIGKTLPQVAQRKHDPIRFNRIDDNERRRLSARRDDIQNVVKHRREAEGRNDDKPDRRYTTRTKPAKVSRYQSPIGSKAQPKDRPPPKRHDEPKVDRKVQARPRTIKKSDSSQSGDRQRDRDRDGDRKDRKSKKDD